MKKTILLLLFAGACHSFAFSQVSLGFRAGTLSSSYWQIEIPDAGNRLLTLAQIGLVGEYAINDQFRVRAELNYAPRGDVWYFEDGENKRDVNRDVFNYLEIPVLVQYTFGTATLQPYGIGGFYMARALSNRYTEDGKRYKVDYPKGDFGLQIGGGATMPLGPGRLFAELRFAQGLKDLDVFEDDTPTRMRSLGISAGWVLDLD